MANDKSNSVASINGGADKRAKFITAAESRVNKALKAIDLVFPITDFDQYTYSQNDHKAVIDAFNDKIDNLNKAFINKGPLAKGFTLDK